MNTALIDAIEARIKAGYAKAAIAAEMEAVGYSAREAEQAYALASARVAETISIPARPHLPPVEVFMKAVWQLFVEQWPVLARASLIGVGSFVFVGSVVFVVALTYGFNTAGSFLTTILAVPFFGMVVGALVSFSLTRALLLRAQRVRFSGHVLFVLRQFFPLALVTLYLSIITQVGYVLFIIPGIMAATYLLFALVYVLRGEARGLSALTESVSLVYGRFFPVLGRFLIMNIVLIVVAALVMGVVGVVSVGLAALGPQLSFVGVPLMIALIIVLVVTGVYWLTCGLVVLYETLERVPAVVTLAPPTRTHLKTLFAVIIGLVIFGLSAVVFLTGFMGYAVLQW